VRLKVPRGIVRIVALVALLGALSTVLFGILQDRHQRQQAEQLLILLDQIRVGPTDRGTVVRLTLPFREYMEHVPPADQSDYLGFAFQNEWLHRLRLAPHTEFRVSITFNSGVVVEKRAWEIVSTTGCAATVVERKRGFGVPSGFPVPPNHHVLAWPDASGQHVWRIRIDDDDTYGEAQRRNDWLLNLTCMTHIGAGCRDARAMLPDAALPPTDSGASDSRSVPQAGAER
jgi:hypothetical protein